jgi:primosomal protein N' (replication factor Y)
VFHKIDRTLRCHHCGLTERVPRACPECGNADIAPIGRGTEQLEEHLGELLAHVKRPDGSPIRIARIDADTTRLKGALESQLASVHSGEVDILVGTQMIAKGHDFRRITLVAAVNPDAALFSSDFRAPERLFALLMQAAGRAGREASQSATSEMWVQTFHPTHPLFEALKNTTTRPLPPASWPSAPPPTCRPSATKPCCVPTPAAKTWRKACSMQRVNNSKPS